ncbi:MAG TPA: PAS domain-containing protein, partial [Gallionella sp.]|nr:PAS domain-containing protein [Gallionella sp.]
MPKLVWSYPRMVARIALFAFGLCVTAAAHAASPLEEWRSEVVATRMLAENDAPRAHEEALRLQANLPVDAIPGDITRVLNLLARIEVYTAQTAAAANHAQLALSLAKKNGDKVGQAEAYLAISLNSVNQGRIDTMLDAAPRALEALQGVDRPDLLGEAMLRVAMMYRRIGQLDESVTLCMQAMDIAKRTNDPMALLYAHQGLGISYDQSDRQADAIEHYKQMRDLARAVHAKQLEADADAGLAAAIGNAGDLRAAESLIREAIARYREVKVPFNIAHGLFSLASNLRQRGSVADSLAPLAEAIAIFERYPNKIGLWWSLIARSENYQTLGRLADARADGERAYALAQDIGQLVYRSDSARRMAALAAATGDHKRAYALSVEAADFAGKVAREKSSKRMVELAQRYQTESKQRQIDELTRREQQRSLEQRWLWTVLGGSVLLLAVTAYFLMRLRKSREEIRVLNVGLEQRVFERTAELHESRKMLTEAQRIAHVGSWENNLVDNVLGWSDEVYRIFEIDPQRFGASYEAFMAAVHPDDREMVDSAFKASLENREAFSIEHRLLLPDGRIKYVHERCETYYSDDGVPLRALGTVQDITELKLAEQQLKRALEFSEGIINAIPDILFEIDREGRYLNVWTQNPELLAAQQQALLGKTVHEVLSPESAAAALAAIREADENGTAVGKVFSIDLPHGKFWFEHSLAKKPGNTPSEATFMVLSRDITERKRMEEALAARERQLRALAESSPGMMGSFYVRPDGSVCMPYVSTNIYELFGLHPQDVAEDASPLLGLNHPDDAQRVRETIAESARTMTPWHCEYRILHPVKGERWMEGNTNPQPHPDGGVIW